MDMISVIILGSQGAVRPLLSNLWAISQNWFCLHHCSSSNRLLARDHFCMFYSYPLQVWQWLMLFKYFFIMSVVVSVVSTVLLGRWHPIMVSPLVLLLRAINGSALSVDSAVISVDRYIAQQSVDRALIDRSLTYHFVHQLCNRPICTIDLT